MKKLLLFMFICSSSFAQSFDEVYYGLKDVQKSYLEYATELSNKNSKKIKELEGQLKPFEYQSLTIGSNTLEVPELSILGILEKSVEDKLYCVNIDLIKIEVYLFMIENVNSSYLKYTNENLFYKNVFKNSEIELLNLAKKALKSKNSDPLDTQFNLLIRTLSAFPFPMEYGFYRRRMMYSISTPRAAQEQIDRLHQSLVNLK